MISRLLPFILRFFYTVKSHSTLHLPFSITTTGLCSYHFYSTSIPCFLHISQWIFVLNPSCRLLYSFWANLLHLLNIWFTFSPAFSHSLHLLFSWVLSIFINMLLVFIGVPVQPLLRLQLFIFSTLFLAIPTDLYLLPIVCLINYPCNCFCVQFVFISFFLLFLYSFGISLLSSIVHAAINNVSLLFLT